MNWDSYRYFLAVAETGSLSAAARNLSVSQPTVGRHIAELEERVGTRLFNRASHGYSLTAAGSLILQKTQLIAGEIASVDRQIAGLDQDYSGNVCISATEGFGAYWLTSRLAGLSFQYPQIQFDLLLDVEVIDTRKREADIAIRLSNPKESELVGRRVSKVGFGLYGADPYFQKFGRPHTISELERHRFIDWHFQERGFILSRALNKYLDQYQVAFRTDTVAAQIEATRQGVGLMLAPHYMIPQESGIHRVLAEEVSETVDLWVLTHKDLRHTNRIRTVIDYLVSAMKADSYVLEHG